MKTNRTGIFAAIVLFVSVLCINPNTVLAMGGPDTITVKGTVDCPTWTKYRKAGESRYLELITVGILTGMQWRPWGQDSVNFWTAKGYELTEDQVFQFIDNYCENGVSHTSVAIWELWFNQTGEPLIYHHLKK